MLRGCLQRAPMILKILDKPPANISDPHGEFFRIPWLRINVVVLVEPCSGGF
jgi:hypothetical protein